MKTTKTYHEQQLTGRQWFWFLAILGLITRLSLLNLASAETTDGVLCLTQFTPDFVDTPRFIIMPGYPFLLWLGKGLGLPGWVWGRLLSTLAGLLFLIPLWKFSRRWVSMEMAGMVCLMAMFSPLLWLWSLKVMPDTLFLFLFWWGLERLTAAYIERKDSVWVEACVVGALAACARPEGFLLLPWLVFLGAKATIETERAKKWMTLPVVSVSILLSWIGPIYLAKDKLLTLLMAYKEGVGLTRGAGAVQFPLLNFIDHLYAYFSQPLYVFTPLVFWFAILGLAKMVRRKERTGDAFRFIVAPIYLVLILSRLIPTGYQDRHMMPFLPVLLVAAAYQFETFLKSLKERRGSLKAMLWKNGVFLFCILYLFIFSSAVFLGLWDSFGDIKRSAEFLKTLPANAVIYTDEIPKTQYWSGRKVTLIDYSQKPFMPNRGDYVILHSFYTSRITVLDKNLKERFGAVGLYSADSMVVPLLTDIMKDPSLQNRIGATALRFQPQNFISVVYEIKGSKQKL